MNKFTSHCCHRILRAAPVFSLALLLISFTGGCSPGDGLDVVSEREERNFQRGKQLLKEGRRQEALGAFLSVIDKRPGDAPESHLEAGELYRTHFKNPIFSIYHYRKHLELSPNSKQARHVKQLIETATKDFARMLPAQPMESQYERLDLLEAVEKLKEENGKLKEALASAREERDRLQARIRTASAAAPRFSGASDSGQSESESRVSPSDEPETYTVVAGDTLSHISGKVYGTSSRWRDIFEANRDRLPNENSLRVGMELVVPE